MTRQRRSSPAGFTLIEMLLVVTVMAVFAAALVVSLKGRQDEHALRTATTELSEALRYAATHARSSGVPCRVAFGAPLDSYQVETLEPQEMKFVPVSGRAGQRKVLTPGIEVAGFEPPLAVEGTADTAVLFAGDGTGFSGLIRLRNRVGTLARIEVMPETGQVNVQK